MPAVVVPKIEMEVSARARHTGIWLAGCAECDWFPEPYFAEETAKQDGYQHNLVRHDGAGVEFQAPNPVVLAAERAEWLTKQVRERYRMLIVTAVLYAAIIALSLSGGVLIGLFFLLYGFVLYQQSRSIGKWALRRDQQREELAQMQAAAIDLEIGKEPPDDA